MLPSQTNLSATDLEHMDSHKPQFLCLKIGIFVLVVWIYCENYTSSGQAPRKLNATSVCGCVLVSLLLTYTFYIYS